MQFHLLQRDSRGLGGYELHQSDHGLMLWQQLLCRGAGTFAELKSNGFSNFTSFSAVLCAADLRLAQRSRSGIAFERLSPITFKEGKVTNCIRAADGARICLFVQGEAGRGRQEARGPTYINWSANCMFQSTNWLSVELEFANFCSNKTVVAVISALCQGMTLKNWVITQNVTVDLGRDSESGPFVLTNRAFSGGPPWAGVAQNGNARGVTTITCRQIRITATFFIHFIGRHRMICRRLDFTPFLTTKTGLEEKAPVAVI
jgi:hypothetical protein